MSSRAPRIWIPAVLAVVAAAAIGVALWRSSPGPPGDGVPPVDRPRATPPNVVVVIIDTLRADYVGAYGHPAAPSPELDRIAAAGVRAETVVAPSTWTRPSIGAIVTGRYPRGLGLYREEGDALAPAAVTLAEVLKDAGYTTLGATANPNINPYYGFDQGFDWYQGTAEPFDWMPAEAVGLTADEARRRVRQGRALPSARAVLDEVLRQVDAHPTGPWYVQVDLMDVHEFNVDSLVLPEDLEDAFADAPTLSVRHYLRAVAATSREVDRFARALYARPGWADTLLVVTSDHGETFDDGEHSSVEAPRWHGHLVYESQALVPLLLYNPADPDLVGVVRAPVGLIDLVPTVLAYAGIDAPADVDGRSFWPDAPAADRRFGVETHFRGVDKIALYAPDWRYIENRAAHAGLPARELQPAGPGADGAATSALDARPEVASMHQVALGAWEEAHPAAPSTPAEGPVPDAIKSQLQAIGYIDE